VYIIIVVIQMNSRHCGGAYPRSSVVRIEMTTRWARRGECYNTTSCGKPSKQ